MSFKDVIKEGFSYSDMSTSKIVVSLLVAFALSMYVHVVYKYATKNQFYNRNYGVSMVVISVITAGIVLAMQSSLVISLGMVGALSIVRFRTAIKDPLDLLFLFWAISIGIVCGAGLYELAIIMSVIATVGILVFLLFPFSGMTCLLVVHAQDKDAFAQIVDFIRSHTKHAALKSKNINSQGMELIFEVKLNPDGEGDLDALMSVPGVTFVNLLESKTNLS